jgi:hypothetical protein
LFPQRAYALQRDFEPLSDIPTWRPNTENDVCLDLDFVIVSKALRLAMLCPPISQTLYRHGLFNSINKNGDFPENKIKCLQIFFWIYVDQSEFAQPD